MGSYDGVPVYVGGKRVPPEGMSVKEAIKKQGGAASAKDKDSKKK